MAIPFDQDFFIPTEAFIRWVADQDWLRYQRVVEIGAGRGLLSKWLRGMHVEVIALDLHERPTTDTEVTIADATTFDYFGYGAAICARPCHNGFMLEAFAKALHRTNLKHLIYIGKPANVEADLEDWLHALLLADAGEDGEAVYRVYGHAADLTPYAQVSEFDGGYWSEVEQDEEGAFHHLSGAGRPLPQTIGDAEVRWMLSSDQAPVPAAVYAKGAERSAAAAHAGHERKGISYDKGQYGYVGPNGEWYPCGSRDHVHLRDNTFTIPDQRLAEVGFIKSYGTFWSFERAFGVKDREHVNERQARTLRRIGYKLEGWEIEERGMDSLPVAEQTEVRRVTFKSRRQLDGD